MCSVTVFGVEGETLAPCHPARARQLLKKKRAVVKSVQPYSIRLLSRSGGSVCNHPTPPFNSSSLYDTDLPTNASGQPHSIAPSTPGSLANPFHGNADNCKTVDVDGEMPQ